MTSVLWQWPQRDILTRPRSPIENGRTDNCKSSIAQTVLDTAGLRPRPDEVPENKTFRLEMCRQKKNNGSVMTSKNNSDFVLFRKLITTRSSQNKSCTIWLIKGMSCGSHSTSSEILIHIMSSKLLLYFRITSNTYFWGPIPQTISADCITKAPLRPRGHETIGGTADHAGFRLVLLLVAVSVLQNRTLIEYKLTAVSSKIWCMSLNSIDHDS